MITGGPEITTTTVEIETGIRQEDTRIGTTTRQGEEKITREIHTTVIAIVTSVTIGIGERITTSIQNVITAATTVSPEDPGRGHLLTWIRPRTRWNPTKGPSSKSQTISAISKAKTRLKSKRKNHVSNLQAFSNNTMAKSKMVKPRQRA